MCQQGACIHVQGALTQQQTAYKTPHNPTRQNHCSGMQCTTAAASTSSFPELYVNVCDRNATTDCKVLTQPVSARLQAQALKHWLQQTQMDSVQANLLAAGLVRGRHQLQLLQHTRSSATNRHHSNDHLMQQCSDTPRSRARRQQ